MKRLSQMYGSYHEILGSENYFKKLNSQYIFGCFGYKLNNFEYYDSMRKVCYDMQNYVQKVYSDAKKNKRIIRFINKDRRDDLINAIKGCRDLSSIVGKSISNIDGLLHLLDLSNSETSSKSGARDYQINEAVKKMANGFGSLGKSECIELVRNAKNRGLTSVIQSNIQYAFFKELIGNESVIILEDIWQQYCFESNGSAKGYNYKEFCSKEYVDSFEKDVLNGHVFYQKRGGSRRYDEHARYGLSQITKMINSDMKSGSKSVYYIDNKNRRNIIDAANQIKKCLIGNVVNINLLNGYNIQDVTLKLHQLMVKGEYEIISEMKRNNSGVSVASEFVNNVRTGGKYDLKSQGWNDKYYYYENRLIEFDAPGNILFGYLGCAMGFPDSVVLRGAGAYQVWSGTSKFSYAGSYFDDPRDQEMIRLGIRRYRDTH